jgi:hypothetical protein
LRAQGEHSTSFRLRAFHVSTAFKRGTAGSLSRRGEGAGRICGSVVP